MDPLILKADYNSNYSSFCWVPKKKDNKQVIQAVSFLSPSWRSRFTF